jgi:DMSO/TMAO reductase YedYZ molybdopterin-dependent catalytic subunit
MHALEEDTRAMRHISRRHFAQVMLGGIALSALSGCASEPTESISPTPTGVASPTPSPTLDLTSRPQPLDQLQNENRRGFYVRYYRPFEPPNPGRWTLSVEGLVNRPQAFTLADLQELPRISQVSRLKCVECWSAAAHWEGFHLSSLMSRVNVQPEATWVHVHCADDYFESLPLAQLLHERSLLVYRMNDARLPPAYGAPLRLIIPPKYGYKSAKVITSLVFASKERVGYWSQRGPYTTEGDIEPGRDHPLDLEGVREIQGGEIFYPDGIESQAP